MKLQKPMLLGFSGIGNAQGRDSSFNYGSRPVSATRKNEWPHSPKGPVFLFISFICIYFFVAFMPRP